MRMNLIIKSTIMFAGLAVTLGLMGACGSEDNGGGGDKVQVVTSLALFKDMIDNVAGDRAEVTALVPGDADPHTYEPIPSQVAKVADADLVLINGLGLEATLEDLINNNVGDGVPVVEMTHGLATLAEEHEGEGHSHEGGNPHLWLNVQNAIGYVERIRDALIEVDPDGAETYRANATAYLDQLEALDAEVEAAIQSIPPEHRKLVTSHDAFPYLADRYGLEVVGVVIKSPGREPSAGEIADLTDQISSQGVPTVFKEPEYSATILEQAAAAAGAEVRTLLSHAFTNDARSYVELMRYNAQQLVEGLR